MNPTLLGASLYLVCGGALFLLGVLVLYENPGDRLHRITAAMMFFGGFGPLLLGAGKILLYQETGTLFGSDLTTSFSYTWQLFFPSLLLFALVFPNERSILRRIRHFWAYLYAPHLFHLLFLLFLGRLGPSLSGLDIAAPARAEGGVWRIIELGMGFLALAFRLLTRVHIRFFSFVDLVYIVLAILLLERSYRTITAPKLRRQLSLILFGLGGCVSLYAISVPLPTLFSFPMPEAVRGMLVSTALFLGTGSIAFAIVRASFLDLGAAIRRAILFSATSGALVLIFFLTARQMDQTLTGRVGHAFPVFQVLFIVAAVIFFHPLMGRIEENVDRIVAGGRAAHRSVLRGLGRELGSILDLSYLKDKLTSSLREALAVEYVDLVLINRRNTAFESRHGGGEDFSIASDHPLAEQITRTVEPVLLEDLIEEIEEEGARRSAREAAKEMDARLIVPIHHVDEGCCGFILLGPKMTGGRFNSEEATLLSLLSTQVGTAIRNAGLHEEAVERRIVDEELTMARSIQESIVPGRSPDIPGIDVAAMNLPSRHVGGDYYDLIPTGNGSLAIAVGDVSGKGVPAAILMSMLHAALHVQMNGGAKVAPLVERLNQVLFRSTSLEQFATFFFGIYNRRNGTIRFTNGGHNYPMLLRRDGAVEFLIKGGLMLGCFEDIRYDEEVTALHGGDLLVFYSDGVTEQESEDEEQFGEERLVETVRLHRGKSAGAIVDAVREDVVRFSGSDHFADDFTLIVLRVGEEEAT